MIHILINGDVQGVGFRQYIRYQANKLNVKGWIKNLPDGGVEAMFVGTAQNLQKMVEISKRGPFLARVKNVEIEELPDQEFDSFQIIKE
jgi:acylphosphatase